MIMTIYHHPVEFLTHAPSSIKTTIHLSGCQRQGTRMFNRDLFRTHGLKIGLIFAVFMMFFSSALGLLEFNLISGLHISVNSELTRNTSVLISRLASSEYWLFIITGLLLSLLLPLLDPLKASLLAFTAILLVYLHSTFSTQSYLLIPAEYFLLMILMLYIVNVLISYFIEIHARQKIIETMGRYIPPHIVEKISKGHIAIPMDGEAKVLSVLFCDIQDFTKIAEELNPKQVVSLLNDYFTVLSKIIFSHNGTIDKFIGDSIMAFWGAPYEQQDHARKAVLSAIEMSNAVENLSARFKKRGWPGPKASFGINTGLMAVGNMGSVYRMSYTVIGDAVNIAARIETLCREYHVPIIVSEATMQACDDILFRELDMVTLKGKRKRTRIYQPLCLKKDADNNLLKTIESHNEGLSSYYKNEWYKARSAFKNLSMQNTDDSYYPVMIEKINYGESMHDISSTIIKPEDASIEDTKEMPGE